MFFILILKLNLSFAANSYVLKAAIVIIITIPASKNLLIVIKGITNKKF